VERQQLEWQLVVRELVERQQLVREQLVREQLERQHVVGQHLVRELMELMAMRTKRSLPTPAIALIAAVITAGVASVAVRLPELGRWTRTDVFALAAMIAVTALAERFALRFRFGAQTKTVTVTEASFAAALILGVRPGVLTLGAVAGIAAANAMRGTALHKAAFNVGSWTASVTAAELVFRAAYPTGAMVAVVPAMAAFFALNAGTVVGVIALVEGRSFASVFGPIARVEFVHAAGDTAAGIVAAIVLLASPATAPVAVLAGALCYGTYRRLAPQPAALLRPVS
jgi:hypothetical protein